jgi:hypothetical protein
MRHPEIGLGLRVEWKSMTSVLRRIVDRRGCSRRVERGYSRGAVYRQWRKPGLFFGLAARPVQKTPWNLFDITPG